ncbi:ABC transporter permease, partial [Mycolicibacillus trivialis]
MIATGAGDRSAIGEILTWFRRYLNNHPFTALHTLGGQMVMGVRAVQYLVIDLVTRRFKLGEFIERAAFMAGTAFAPTVLVTIPIGV